MLRDTLQTRSVREREALLRKEPSFCTKLREPSGLGGWGGTATLIAGFSNTCPQANLIQTFPQLECIARWFKMVSSYQFSLAIVQVETSMRESSRRELFVHGQLEALSASSILSILKIVIPNISRPFGCSTHASQSERTFYPLTLFICSINGYHGEYY